MNISSKPASVCHEQDVPVKEKESAKRKLVLERCKGDEEDTRCIDVAEKVYTLVGPTKMSRARFDIPEDGRKWVYTTLSVAWKLHKARVKKAYYTKYDNDEERLENRPDRVPLEDFKMLLKYWGDAKGIYCATYYIVLLFFLSKLLCI
ncbi:hypothetical protein DCAR_0519873 [Daucus carota subsp. sativus]|uniref:Uncharacterized protein n=1 Tax=Daucus carota subsp. sativus TaxID=79200 RepID=A0AAF0X344_DAUCS|nr:hypothetical protein DCAR_0519873 [Daucus carota subsp. sativus]